MRIIALIALSLNALYGFFAIIVGLWAHSPAFAFSGVTPLGISVILGLQIRLTGLLERRHR